MYDLVVHPQVQGLGLGRRMLKMLVQQVCGCRGRGRAWGLVGVGMRVWA